MDLMTSWEKEGLEKGLEQGRRDALCDILEARFGPVPEPVQAELSKVTDLDRLRDLSRLAATLQSLGDFQARL